MKLYISFIFIFCFSIFTIAQDNTFNIIGEANGNTKKEARLNSLNVLSNRIISIIDSKTVSKKQSSSNKFKSSFTTLTTIKSKILLKGVKFNITKTNNGFKSIVYFDIKAYESTISYLLSIIDTDSKGFNEEKLKDYLNTTNFLNALLYYPSINNTNYPKLDKIKKFTKKTMNILSYRLSEYGSITFNMIKNKDALIYVEGKKYKISEEIFLPIGVYKLEIRKNGYKTIKAKVKIRNKKWLHKTLTLVANRNNNISIFIVLNNFDNLHKDAKKTINKIFNKNNLEITHSNTYKYKFLFNYESETKISSPYIHNNTIITLLVMKNNKVIDEIIKNKKFITSKSSLTRKRKKNMILLLNKVIKEANTLL